MTNSIIQRLKRLEQISPNRLVILADFDGVEKQCTVDELKRNPAARFIRVLDGDSVKDLDAILNYLDVMAGEE